jgi:tetratricopeptide (TPR) repeat protein
MSDFDLQEKFPDLRPINSPPSLSTVNGFGFCVIGHRDHDEETNTYVKTHCFCGLFIPLLAVGAYRVADAPQGWYFLGKVPLSRLAKLWNLLVLSAIVGSIGLLVWHEHTQSPGYIAGQQLGEADRLAEAGKLGAAARLYRQVAEGFTDRAPEGMARIRDLLDGPVQKASAAEAAEVFQVAAALKHRPGGVTDLFERGKKLIDRHAPSDPAGALRILDAVAGPTADAAAVTALRRRLLERQIKKEPDNPEPATALALLLEKENQLDRCEKLLAPHVKKLGSSEGARILGHIYARKGKLEEAHALLLPYAEENLKKLKAAEKSLNDTINMAIWRPVNTREAPDFPYAEHKAASKEEKLRIENEYQRTKMTTDPVVKAAVEAVRKEARVVPVALDLGIVLLHRAQGMADPAARHAELKKAEKMFLEIRGVAGRSDEYRLNLGQVYYWLGKHREGRKLFDELLAARQRQPSALLTVSRLLREVGAVSEARTLAEEAYTNEKNPQTRYAIAISRSLISIDQDDEITWLRRSDPASGEVKAMLSAALGNKAAEEGKDEEAVRQLRQAVTLYGQLPPVAGVLNNTALIYFSLYRLTGDRKDLDKGGELLEKAIALQPSNSISLFNAANNVWETALRDVIGTAIDLKILKMGGTTSLLPYLYKDQAGQDRYVERIRNHPATVRAVSFFGRLLVLSPKNSAVYSTVDSLHHTRRDLKALEALARRLEQVDLDLSDATRQTLEYYSGKSDARSRKDLRASAARFAEAVQAARRDKKGVTLAVAADRLLSCKIGLDTLGEAVAPNEIVALAEEAHAAAPSAATHASLVNALLFRASRTLARQEPAYAAMVKKALRSLGHSLLIAVALSGEDRVRQAALANKDVERAAALLKDNVARFPREPQEWWWAVLRATHPEEAAQVAQAVLRDDLGRIQRSINLKLSPVSGRTAFEAYWASQIAGKEAEGIAILKSYATRGVPLPFDPQ